jgi:hypothetical protein
MRRTPLLLAVLAAGATALATAGAASADAAQPVTFTLSGGGLSMSAPTTTVNLAVNGGSTQASGQLGAVTVTDGRATFLGSYTVNMTAIAFDHDGANDGGYAIPASAVTGYSGAATANTGTAVLVTTSSLLPAAIGGATGATIFQGTLEAGGTTATYNPTVLVAIPSTALSGSYTGSVTQTVS